MGVIKLLSAAVADQIAAGEVIGRPSSVVKELMENAVDAGASQITLVFKEGGHSLIQIIDNGCGMSADDALTAFKRHATSKIMSAEDLYGLSTFGFRGEALPSIASVAEVEMRTRRKDDDLGVEVTITASNVTSKKEVNCPVGTAITVRQLFFNIPARRKFLKNTTYEKRVIINEYEKIAMANPHIEFTFKADDEAAVTLRPATLRERVSAIVKKSIDKALLPVEVTTQYLSIKGWVSSPAQSGMNPTKNSHFFVNGRFMRNMALQKAVGNAFGRILPQGNHPYFYIFITIDPSKIDVNIHPTKTEIKFEDEEFVWQVIHSAVKKSLGIANAAPSIDFANPVTIDIPPYNPIPDHQIKTPRTTTNKSYNPFFSTGFDGGMTWKPSPEFDPEQIPFHENLPKNLLSLGRRPAPIDMQENEDDTTHQWEETPSEGFAQSELDIATDALPAIQWNTRYLIYPNASGITLIDYPRALERIAFERLETESSVTEHSQLELLPEQLELSMDDAALINEHAEQMSQLGFEIGDMGGGHITVYSMPAALAGKVNAATVIEELLEILGDNRSAEEFRATIVAALARSASRSKPRKLAKPEIAALIEDLIACREPAFTPAGLPVLSTLSTDEIEKRLKKR